MTISVKKIEETVLNLLTIMLLSAIYIFGNYIWGKYIILIISFIIFSFSTIRNKGKYKINIDIYVVMMGIWISFTFFSAIWALNPYDSIQKGITFIQILVCMYILYNAYSENMNVKALLNCLMYTSYIVSIYAINYYGIDVIIKHLERANRLENSFINSNTLGIMVAIGILIRFNQYLSKKKMKITDIFLISNIIILIASQSKKAIIAMIIGIIGILILENWNYSKKKIIAIFKILIKVGLVIFIIMQLSRLPIFSGVTNRFYLAFESIFKDSGQAGSSTEIRKKMIEIGLNQFKETPVLGIGIGNPHYLALNYMNYDAYLHNNYVELLAGGGIFGVCIYYGIYLYIIIELFINKKFKNKEYNFICILLILFLFMDVGMVSSYEKITYFYFMMFFLEIKILKKGNLKVKLNEFNEKNF